MYVLEWYGMEWRVKRSECRIEYGAHMNILFFSSFRSRLSTCSVIFFSILFCVSFCVKPMVTFRLRFSRAYVFPLVDRNWRVSDMVISSNSFAFFLIDSLPNECK